MNYVDFTSQCGLWNRENGKKLLKLQVGLLLLKPSCSWYMKISKSIGGWSMWKSNSVDGGVKMSMFFFLE